MVYESLGLSNIQGCAPMVRLGVQSGHYDVTYKEVNCLQ